MGQFVVYDNQFFHRTEPIFRSQNRAFKYGDGLFETIRLFDGKLPFIRFHFQRLASAMQFIGIEIPEHFTEIYFDYKIKELAEKNNIKNGRIRLTVFRKGDGLYTPTNNNASYFIETTALEENHFTLNERGLVMNDFTKVKLSLGNFSNIKSLNALPYIMAKLFCKENGLDDCFMMNSEDRIAEASSSNIFLIHNNKLITPILSEGCLAGVMRFIVLQTAFQNDYEVEEREINESDFANAQEIWLTNSIQGIQWVRDYKSFSYENKLAKEFVGFIN